MTKTVENAVSIVRDGSRTEQIQPFQPLCHRCHTGRVRGGTSSSGGGGRQEQCAARRRSELILRHVQVRQRQCRCPFCRRSIGSSRRVQRLQENDALFEFSLCLSRACLGTMIIYGIKMAQKDRFYSPLQARRHPHHRWCSSRARACAAPPPHRCRCAAPRRARAPHAPPRGCRRGGAR
jgi:hypothetical protein